MIGKNKETGTSKQKQFKSRMTDLGDMKNKKLEH